MKKFIIKFLLFLVLLGGVVYLFARFDNLDKKWNSDHNVLKVVNMSHFDSLHILFLGNSYCYSSIYSPLFDSLHIKTFNLGVATSGPRYCELLFDDYISSVKKKPDTVMLLVSPMSFSTQADDWENYPIHRYLNKPESNEEVALKYGSIKDYPVMVFNSLRKGLNNLIARGKNIDSKELNKIYEFRGLFVDSTVTSDDLEKSISPLFTPLLKDHFDEESAQLMSNLAHKIKAMGITVIFFEVPTNHLNNYFSPDFLNSYESYCNKISKDYPLLRNGLHLTTSYFRNIDHTNTQGAYQFTSYLIANLYHHNPTAKISGK